jgi:spore maturation protein CgeB
MYQEGKEALFWGDVDECAAMCRYALEDEQRRLTIAAAGRERIVANGNYNEQAIKFILERLFL